jgi:hypothetical protein
MTEATPTPGTPACYQLGSDQYPFTVVTVSASGKTVTLREATSRRTDKNGYYTENQRFIFADNPKGRILKATLRKDGAYRAVGCRNYGRVTFGEYGKYNDPSF